MLHGCMGVMLARREKAKSTGSKIDVLVFMFLSAAMNIAFCFLLLLVGFF